MSDTVIPKILRIPLLAAISLFALGSPLAASAAPDRDKDDDVVLVDDTPEDEPKAASKSSSDKAKPKKSEKSDKKKPAVKKAGKQGDKKLDAKAGKSGKAEKSDKHGDKKKVAAKGKSKPKAKDEKGDRVASKGGKDTSKDKKSKDKDKDKARAKDGDHRVASRDKKDDGTRALSGARPSRASHPSKPGPKKDAVPEGKTGGERSRKKVSRRDAQEKRNAAAAEKPADD